MIRRILAGAIALALIPAVSRAQDRCPSCTDSVSGRWHMLPGFGLRGGIPQKVSMALGIVAGRNTRQKGRSHDVALYVEPGLSAGRVSLGYINAFGNAGSGVGFAATGLRTWKDPINLKTNETFVGGEVWVWPVFFSGPRIGLFRKVTGVTRGWYFTADFGFGL